MGAQMAEFEAIPYSIRIDVTSHRVLTEPGEIALRVDEALDK
jgi:hypothetical protein